MDALTGFQFSSSHPFVIAVDRNDQNTPNTIKAECQKDNYGLYALKFSRSSAKRNDIVLDLTTVNGTATIDRHRSTVKRDGHGSINGQHSMPRPYVRAIDRHEYFEPCQSHETTTQPMTSLHIEDLDTDDNDIDECYQIEFNETRGIKDMKKYHAIDRHRPNGADRSPNPRAVTNSINDNNRMECDRNGNDSNFTKTTTMQRPPPPPLPPKRTRNSAQKNRRCHSASPKPTELYTKSNAAINPITNQSIVPNQRNRYDHISSERLPFSDNASGKLSTVPYHDKNGNTAINTLENRCVLPGKLSNKYATEECASTIRSSNIVAVTGTAAAADGRIHRSEYDMSARTDDYNQRNNRRKDAPIDANRKQSYFFARGNTWQLDKISAGDVSTDYKAAYELPTQLSDDTESDVTIDAKQQELQRMLQQEQVQYSHYHQKQQQKQQPEHQSEQKYQQQIITLQNNSKNDPAKPNACARKTPSTINNCSGINQYSIDSDEFSVYTHRKKYSIEMI